MDVDLDFQKTSKEFNTLMTILKGYIQGFIYEVKEKMCIRDSPLLIKYHKINL